MLDVPFKLAAIRSASNGWDTFESSSEVFLWSAKSLLSFRDNFNSTSNDFAAATTKASSLERLTPILNCYPFQIVYTRK